MPPKIRIERIAGRIREDIAELLLYEISDPRLGGVSVTDVSIDRELAFADVYVSTLEGSARAEEVLAGLQSAAGFIRGRLAKTIQLRTFPVLRFHWDPTPERADRIERLLHELRGSDEEESLDESLQDGAEDAEE